MITLSGGLFWAVGERRQDADERRRTRKLNPPYRAPSPRTTKRVPLRGDKPGRGGAAKGGEGRPERSSEFTSCMVEVLIFMITKNIYEKLCALTVGWGGLRKIKKNPSGETGIIIELNILTLLILIFLNILTQFHHYYYTLMT